MTKVIVFAAPSASGKSTLINYLMKHELNLQFSVSCTNRAPRPLYENGPLEEDGVHYFFLSPEAFEQHIQAGDFLEYEEVYPGRYYGTLRQQVDKRLAEGHNVIGDLDVKGALNVKRHYGDRCLAVFIQAPSLAEIEKRLRGRGSDTEESIASRLERASYELTFAKDFDCTIVNDDLATAQAEILQLVTAFINKD